MTKKILIAKIITAFGIKGEVKIVAYCQDHLNLEKYSLSDAQGNAIRLVISNKNKVVVGIASGDPIVIAKIDGVTDRNAAELLRGVEIFADRTDFAPAAKNEFYYADLIGLTVVDMNSKEVGTVMDVLDYGAGGVIEIKFLDNHTDNFPFKDQFFPEVNLTKGFIRLG
ncbi:MAG: 16S rRNA processing protein RimM [Alphaproteobacteria bacterium]|nr:16S rRNA processing protein RimM [Alphaproteobacteria bacterium]